MTAARQAAPALGVAGNVDDCGLGPYNFEFMTEVKQEIMARCSMDGIFINRWDGSGQCY